VIRWFFFLVLVLPSLVEAQHTRIYAVVAGNDDPANNMAGSSLGSGLWQSDDTGRTWRQLGWKHIKAFSMDHDSNGRMLYLAAGNGVLKSSDYGESWKVMTDWRVAEVMDVMIHPRKRNIVLAATGRGVIRSTDAGATWNKASRGIDQPYTSKLYSFEGEVYVCAEDGLFYTRDEARSWHLVNGSPSAVRAVSRPTDRWDVVAAGENSVLQFNAKRELKVTSLPGTSVWDLCYWQARPARGLHLLAGNDGIAAYSFGEIPTFSGPKNVHAIVTVGNHVIAGTLGEGLMISDDLTEWRQLGLPKSQVWRIKLARVQ
jgi:hypothetical protein